MTGTTVVKQPLRMTRDSILAFLDHEKARGSSADCLRQRKTFVERLYLWLPDEKQITYENLRTWRKGLLEQGCSEATVSNYAKGVNRYLDYMGRSDLRFSQGKSKDLSGRTFGYLTPLENTGKKQRNDYVWRCRCKCGNEVLLPATRLLTGNTMSCGCLLAENLDRANRYVDHTSLRAAMEEKVHSERASSGYTGVVAKGGKWQARIYYKGICYSLGCYSDLEEAVKARGRAKELVREDAQRLTEIYELLHRDDPPLPGKKQPE